MSIIWYDKEMNLLNAKDFVKKLYSSESESSDYSRDGTNRGKKSGGTCERRRCPLIDCKSKVVHIPWHLQDVHGWSRMHARTALVHYGMRKTYSFSHPKKAPENKKQSEEEASKRKGSKDYHYYRYCPLQGCTSLVKRLPPHLAKVHKLPPDEVKRTLSKVIGKRVCDSHRVPIHERRLQHSNTFQDESDQPSMPEHGSEIVCSIILSDNMSEKESNKDEDTLETVSKNVHAHEVLKNFKTWLQSADGGQLDAKTTQQHFKQMLKLLSIINEKSCPHYMTIKDAICLLGKLTGAQNMEIFQRHYTWLRDFLIVKISIDNASRSGALANMKTGEFKKTKTEGDGSVILVKDHKTMASHGPARILLSQRMIKPLLFLIHRVFNTFSGRKY
ncbi:uncharacterized protein [Acropora muricata]|uniref:uncharacterized protein n=1 Tax=Acropora muricata TaxID=159855 RepID=UPI0034E3E46D